MSDTDNRCNANSKDRWLLKWLVIEDLSKEMGLDLS